MLKSGRAGAILLFGSGLLMLVAGFSAYLWLKPSGMPAGAVVTQGKVAIGGPFKLVDQNGETRTSEDFLGSYALIFFGYTYCPDVCPTTLYTVTQALGALSDRNPEQASQVVPIFVTIDPERDTVEVLKSYTENFHPRLVALTGPARQIEAVAHDYGVFYAKVLAAGTSDYLMDHSSFIFLMGPDGNYLTHFSHDITADELANQLSKHVSP